MCYELEATCEAMYPYTPGRFIPQKPRTSSNYFSVKCFDEIHSPNYSGKRVTSFLSAYWSDTIQKCYDQVENCLGLLVKSLTSS